jgi:hypothetical protein
VVKTFVVLLVVIFGVLVVKIVVFLVVVVTSNTHLHCFLFHVPFMHPFVGFLFLHSQ